jgi:hypothetical protein
MRGGLVGEDIRHDAAFDQLRNDIGAVADQADGDGFLFADGVLEDTERLVERVDHEVAVAGLEALLDALGVDVNAKECRAGHRRSEGLRATHTAHATGDDQFALERPAEVLLRAGSECLIRSLNDSL